MGQEELTKASRDSKSLPTHLTTLNGVHEKSEWPEQGKAISNTHSKLCARARKSSVPMRAFQCDIQAKGTTLMSFVGFRQGNVCIGFPLL